MAAGLTVFSLYRLQPAVSDGRVLVYWMGGWQPRDGLGIGISLSLDAWGLLIALIIAVIGFLSLLYSAAYLRHETGREAFYVLFMLLIAALIGFALSGDLFNQLWLGILCSGTAPAYHYNRRLRRGTFKYLITNSIASLFIAVALSLLYMQTGAEPPTLRLPTMALPQDSRPGLAGWDTPRNSAGPGISGSPMPTPSPRHRSARFSLAR
jgi:multicomponent Na+:H+ antiporter subunit D